MTTNQPDYARAFFGGAMTDSLLQQNNAKFRNGYLTTNELSVERVVDRFQAAKLFAAAEDIRLLGQVAQDLLDLCIVAEPDEPFDWAVIENAITSLRSLLA